MGLNDFSSVMGGSPGNISLKAPIHLSSLLQSTKLCPSVSSFNLFDMIPSGTPQELLQHEGVACVVLSNDPVWRKASNSENCKTDASVKFIVNYVYGDIPP